MAKFCSNCGTPYEEGVAFCANCGANLAAPAVRKAPKSAITVAGLRDIAAKRAKAMMIIVLVVSLLIGLATVTGSIDLIAKGRYDGKITDVNEVVAREAYIKTGEGKIDAITTSAKVLNLIYGITLLGVAALTILAMLENACGGNGACIFKKATIVAAGMTFLYAILFVILCRVKVEAYNDYMATYVLAAPISAWVNLALFGGIAALNCLPEKKDA
jgi:hypothetical protein